RLIEVGHDVTVWNRTPDKARAVEGAKIAANPAELAENSEVIITILTDAAALNAVYNGGLGLLHGKVAERLFIDMSTVLPATEIA
ncbi:NAD(P)-binding domain-containing protein, partial [Klebsiella pneumoniae]|uniref:NAD(P)-binding domain-containing protein n=1 Tax=Klebsiella pneumoniae TaxID=573 RepID=UPI003013ED31